MEKIKKYFSLYYIVLLVLQWLPPLVSAYALLKAYNVHFNGKAVYIVLTMLLTAIAAGLAVLLSIKRSRVGIVLTMGAFLASMANLVIFSDYIVIACMGMICAYVLLIRQVPRITAVITTVVMSVILTVAVFFIMYIGAFSGIGGENTVYKEVLSPDGRFTAQIVISDQGAMGGNTRVELDYNELDKKFLCFELEKKTARLYSGKYAEYQVIAVEWQDAVTLLINGEEYRVWND